MRGQLAGADGRTRFGGSLSSPSPSWSRCTALRDGGCRSAVSQPYSFRTWFVAAYSSPDPASLACSGCRHRDQLQITRYRTSSAAGRGGLRDAFPNARQAGLMALKYTTQYYEPVELSSRIVPSIAPLMTDVEQSVREEAFETMNVFMEILRRNSNAMKLGPEEAQRMLEAEQAEAHEKAKKKASKAGSMLSSSTYFAFKFWFGAPKHAASKKHFIK